MLGEGESTGDQGEDGSNDADSSDDESIIAGDNENNTSTIQQNSPGNDDRRNRQTASGRRDSREDSFGTQLVPGGRNAAAHLHGANSVGPPSREALLEAWQQLLLMQQQQQNPQHNGHTRQVQGADQMMQHGDAVAYRDVQQGGQIDSNDEALIAAGRKALSYRVAKVMQKKHVKSRIQALVKSHIFRKCKFITSSEYYDKVMKVVLDAEKPADPAKFVRIYKTCVLGSLNSKRSSCEQSASDAVAILLKTKNHRDEVTPEPYSIEMLCKLRQSQTLEEREAFQWFTGELLECVVGKIAWGSRKKYRSRISDAVYDNTAEYIVTVSDEAFALLLYENYIGKWITRYHNPPPPGEKGKKIMGKYTRSSIGYAEYGGWCEEGVIRFNELCAIVVEDRKSRNAKDAEERVMLSLRRLKYGEQVQNGAANGNDELSIVDSERSLERNVGIVNAFIEL